MALMYYIKDIIIKITKKISLSENEHIGAYAAKSSYFMILSFIPVYILVIFILNTLFPDYVILNNIFNKQNSNILTRVNIKDLLTKNYILSILSVFFAILITSWSGGKAFLALKEAFNIIIKCKKSKNYMIKRLKASFISIIFAFIIVLTIILTLFGEKIIKELFNISEWSTAFTFLKFVLFALSVWILISCAYIFLPDWEKICYNKFLKLIFKYGILSSVSICLLMIGFSIYVSFRSKNQVGYGDAEIIITFMLWLYFCMYVIILNFKLLSYKIKKKN